MTTTIGPSEAYRQYREGRRSLDSLFEFVERWGANYHRTRPEPDPEILAAEEAEARQRWERSRAKPLWDAYIQSTWGKRSIESVFYLEEHMRDFLRHRVDLGADGREPSPVEAAYQRVLDGDLPLDDMLALADRHLAPSGGAAG